MVPPAGNITDILERIPDAFIALDDTGCITYANQRAGEITGRVISSLIGKHIWNEFPEARQSVFFDAITNAMELGQYQFVSDYYAPLDCWVETHIYPGQGNVSVFIKEITEQKKAEEKLIRANRLYSFVSSINKMIVRTTEEEILFKEVCEIAVKIGKFRMAWIGKVNEKTKVVVPVAHAGEDKGYLSAIKQISVSDVPEGRGPTGTAIREGVYMVCNDIEQDPDMAPWKEEALNRGYLSSIALPIRRTAEIVGVLSVYASRKLFFDTTEIALLEEAAGDISFALENIRKEELRKATQQQLAESEEKFRTLVEEAADGIFIVDQEGNYKEANESAARITGYSIAELKRMNGKDIVPEEELKRNPIKLVEIKKGDRVFIERVIRRKDGTLITVEISAKLMDHGNVITIMRNVSDRKRAEQQLQQSYNEIRRLASHLQHIREEERLNMSREIHDELGQQLTVMKMDVSWLQNKLADSEEGIRKKTEELRKMIDHSIQSIRRIASDLRPGILDDMGLGAAIEWQLKEFENRFGVHTEFDNVHTGLFLPDTVKINLFRIVQESLTNVGRYAKARNVTVKMFRQNGKLTLQIGDDGLGFDNDRIAAKKTLGIIGMKERTAMLGGHFEIRSNPGMGTLINISVPLTA